MKKEWMKYAGSMQQLAYVRPLAYKEGRAENMNAWEIKSGHMAFHVMADKCLDISDLSYKGMNMSFMAKPGLMGRGHYDTHGQEAQRSIMGGLLFTCGLETICAPCNVDGRDYPMHGRMRTTPAEHAGADAYFDGDEYVISVKGEMREAELFGENMVLRRTIETRLGSNSILVTDEIENQAFRPEPLMLLYHCNMGYPFLDETCEQVLPVKQVTGREAFAEQHVDRWNWMDEPKPNEPEYVFLHDMSEDESGTTMAMVVNHGRKLALCLEFNRKNLPYFMEWKSMASGDYALGLEPSNSSVYGKPYHISQDKVHYLQPFEKEVNQIRFTVLEGEEAIRNCRERIIKIKGEPE